MLDYKRRMPRLTKIPQIKATKKDIDKLRNAPLSQEVVTTIRLRHAKMTFKNADEVVLNAFKRALPEDYRLAELKDNIKKVESENRYSVLFDFLSSRTGNDALSPLIRKLRNKNQNLFEDVLSKLISGYTDTFMDNALIILDGEFEYHDIGDRIVDTLKSGKIRDPLDFASLAMVVGRSKTAKHIDFLYTFYVFFKDNFPDKEYYEGPLLGLKDLLERLEY